MFTTGHNISLRALCTIAGAFLVLLQPEKANAQQQDNERTTFIKKDPIGNQLGFFDLNTRSGESSNKNFFLSCNISTTSISDNIEFIAEQYLNELSPNLGFSKDEQSFNYTNTRLSQHGSKHVSFEQFINGIPVFGSEMIVHFDEQQKIRAISGAGNQTTSTQKTASIPASVAIQKAKEAINAITKAYYLNAHQRAILGYKGAEACLVYLPLNNGLELCWKVNYCPNFRETWLVFISSVSGEVMYKKELSCNVDGPKKSDKGTTLDNKEETIGTYRIDDTFYLIDAGKEMYDENSLDLPYNNPKGVIRTFNAKNYMRDELENASIPSSTENAFGKNNAEKAAVSAQVNASLFYDKLESAPFNWTSYDNEGSSIIMYTSMRDPLDPIGWDNAGWNGRVTFFGEGYNLFKSPLSKGLDVVSHELTHGLIEHGTNIQNSTSIQNKALIEAICDIMAIVVDGNFTIGENSDLNKDIRQSGLIRNTESPHNGLSKSGNWGANQSKGYTANHMNEFVNDAEAAHYNSTIISYAFYLMTGKTIGDGIGMKVASELFFDVVTNYLGAGANFYDFKDAMLLAVDIRFGAGSGYYNVIKKAFNTVGLETNQQVISPDDLPSIIGENFIISNIAAGEDELPSQLSVFKIEDASEDIRFNQIDATNNNTSITDNGSFIYAVNDKNSIIRINYGEQLLVSSLDNSLGSGYSQVAVSKKNERLALAKLDNDTSIHVFDIVTGLSKKFPLNMKPITVVHGFEFYTAIPIKVGSMEWNYDGNKIIFEYESSFIDNEGIEQRVWNIAEIDAWDNEFEDFGTGDFHVFYDQLSSDLDLRYPSFSKNTTTLFVHDVYDKRKSQNTIVAWNRLGSETIKSNIIRTSIPSHASYTNTDSGLVYTDLDKNGKPTLFLVQLKSDKISVKKGIEPIEILSERENPRWFTLGIRSSLAPSPTKNKLSIYPNPTSGSITISGFESTEAFAYSIYNYLGQEMLNGQTRSNGQIDISEIKPGNYLIRLRGKESNSVIRFVKE